MQHTPKLNLNKPDLNDYVNIADLNENMDILDTAVGELKEGSTVIPELETVDKTLAGAINEIDNTLTTHMADYSMHKDQLASPTAPGHVKAETTEDGTLLIPKLVVRDVNPTENNDVAEGYSVGDRWLNDQSVQEFVCLNTSGNNAIWAPMTQGISPLLYDNGEEKVQWVTGYQAGSGVAQKQSDSLLLTARSGTPSGRRTFITESRVDLSLFSKLYVDWEKDRGPANATAYVSHFFISDTPDGSGFISSLIGEKPTTSKIRVTESLDVRNLKGSYYVGFTLTNNSGYSSETITVSIYKVWGEAY